MLFLILISCSTTQLPVQKTPPLQVKKNLPKKTNLVGNENQSLNDFYEQNNIDSSQDRKPAAPKHKEEPKVPLIRSFEMSAPEPKVEIFEDPITEENIKEQKSSKPAPGRMKINIVA